MTDRPQRPSPFSGSPRDPARIGPIVVWLREAWEANTDWRLGQLIVNAAPGRDPSRLFYAEDDVLLEGLMLQIPGWEPDADASS